MSDDDLEFSNIFVFVAPVAGHIEHIGLLARYVHVQKPCSYKVSADII